MIHRVMLGGGVAEVKGLAGEPSSEEGGIAGSGSLGDLVAYGEEVHAELARLRVWFHNDAFLLVMHQRHTNSIHPVLPIHQMGHGEFQRVFGQIARHADNIADIVTFQFKHQTKVVAQVIGGEAKS